MTCSDCIDVMVPVSLTSRDCLSTMQLNHTIQTRRGKFFVHSKASIDCGSGLKSITTKKPHIASDCTCPKCEFQNVNQCEVYCRRKSITESRMQSVNCRDENQANTCVYYQNLIDTLIDESNEF